MLEKTIHHLTIRNFLEHKLIKYVFVGLFLFFFNVMAMAHEGEPNMAFAWRDGKIEIDIRHQGRLLGDHTAFVIPFADVL